ncbi:MAG TPA: nuclease-related domain-containing protein [Opitutaceae bacterium]|nr:nuclease-related domain-containing protein [Opitutaceae bacterium]
MPEIIWRLIREIVENLFWVALFSTPVVALLWRVARERRKYDEEAKIPFTEFPLRPPGESSRVAAEKLFETAMENLLVLMGSCAVFGMTVAGWKNGNQLTLAGMGGLIVLGVTAVTAPRILRTLRNYWKYRLGFRGERLVGQELDQLLSKGYRVFHDVPFEGFNVDHVAVGPAGVFVIETKARRKWKVKDLKHPAHMVRYDGNSLTWPSGRADRFGLEQTERNAHTVSEWLSNATGEDVFCQPILTLPGWWVERRLVQRPKVIVLSSKKLHRYFPTTSPKPIRTEQVRRIIYHLGERCRLDDSAKTP